MGMESLRRSDNLFTSPKGEMEKAAYPEPVGDQEVYGRDSWARLHTI